MRATARFWIPGRLHKADPELLRGLILPLHRLPAFALRASTDKSAGELSPLILPLHHLLPLLAQPLNPQRHHVALFQEHRRLHAEADARRRTGDDDVARVHDEKLRAVPDPVSYT